MATNVCAQAEGADTLKAGVKLEDVTCCAQMYAENDGKSCDLEEMKDHYCEYVNWAEYTRVTTGGVIVTILMTVIMVIVVGLRDIMKVWSCGGLTDAAKPTPNRQLTTMSAAYAAETMGEGQKVAPEFQNVQVPMGGAPMSYGMPMMQPGMAPMQPMMQQGMPMMPMGSMPMR